MKRAALYIRVSTAEQKIHGLSLETQQENLDEWAKREQVIVVDHYIDPEFPPAKRLPSAQGFNGCWTMYEPVRSI